MCSLPLAVLPVKFVEVTWAEECLEARKIAAPRSVQELFLNKVLSTVNTLSPAANTPAPFRALLSTQDKYSEVNAFDVCVVLPFKVESTIVVLISIHMLMAPPSPTAELFVKVEDSMKAVTHFSRRKAPP